MPRTLLDRRRRAGVGTPFEGVAGVAQLVRAPDCDSGCRRFEPGHSPQFFQVVSADLSKAVSVPGSTGVARKGCFSSPCYPRAVTQSRGRIATAKRARSHLQEIGHGYNVRGPDDFEAENQVILKNRITAAALQKGFDELPGDPPLNGVTKSLALGAGVIRGFLGNFWFDRHILPEGKKGFLTIDESTPERREET